MVDAAKDHLLANRFDPDKIRVVKPGVDTSVFFPGEQEHSTPTVVFISPLAPNKGIDIVLAAMKIVQVHIPEARLLVAGRGPLEPEVRQAQADPKQTAALMASLDAFGVGELLRRGSCGLPVVTTRCGSNEEAIAPGNDLISDYSVEAIADKIIYWLTHRTERTAQGEANAVWARTNHDLLTQCRAMGQAFTDIEALNGR